MPKDKSDANSVFDMVKSLRDRYGAADEAPKEDEKTSTETLAEELAKELEEAANEVAEEAVEAVVEEPGDLPVEVPAEEPIPEEIVEETPEKVIEEVPEVAPIPEEAPLVEEPAIEEPATEEPVFEEPATAEPVFEEPALAEEPIIEEQPAPSEEPLSDDLSLNATEEPFEEDFDEEDEEDDEEEDEDDVPENQIAIEVETAKPEPASEPESEPEVAAEPEQTPPAPEKAPEPFLRPMRSAPLPPKGKPVASEQLFFENLPVMKNDHAAKPTEETASVEALERSIPDLSTLSDEERLRRSGLSKEDIRMMLAFGYEDDLKSVLGHRTVRKLKYLGGDAERGRQDLRPFAYAGKEYDGSPEERTTVLNAYRKDRVFLFLRLVLTGISCLMLLFCDVWARRALTSGSSAFIPLLYGLILLLLTAAFSHRTLAWGYKSLIYFAPTPHSIPALILPIAVSVDLLSIFGLANSFPAVNFPVSALFFLSALGDVFRFTSEKRSFLVLSSASSKLALEPFARHKKKMQRENRIVCLIDDTPDLAEYRVRKVSRVTGFFRRTSNLAGSSKHFSIFLSLSLGLAALGGLISWIFLDGILPAISNFVTLFLFAAPASAIFAFFYPACLASKELALKGSALVGEESIAELEQKKTILFDDHLAFTAENCTEVSLRNDTDSKQDLRLSGILFRKLGGVLADIAVPLFPEEPDPVVSVLRIREDGVEALVDNRYHLLAGSREYLVRHGIRCPAEPKTKTWQSADSANLFVAIDDVLKLRYTLEYHETEAFKSILAHLREYGTEGGIFTYDPCLNEAFLTRLYGNDQAPAVVKPGTFDEETDVSITDASVVALKEESALADSIEAAATIRKARKLGFRVQWIASIVGAAFATIAALFGKPMLLGLGTLIAFHLATLIITWGIETAQFHHNR